MFSVEINAEMLAAMNARTAAALHDTDSPGALEAVRVREAVDRRYNRGYTISMKTAISIPDDLFAEAESVAARLGLSRSEMFARAVRAFVQRNRHKSVTDRLNRVYTAESSALDPAIADLQASSIPHEEW